MLIENKKMNYQELKEALDKARSQLYIFYELAQAMRTTLRLDEVAYIILTGLTAHQGLGFNRAMLFLVNEPKRAIEGFMGIGPIDAEEANKIWKMIETQKMDLYALIDTYNRIKEGKVQPKLMQLIQSLEFSLHANSGLIYETLHEMTPLHITLPSEKYRNDVLLQKLGLKDFIIASLWSKNTPLGVVIVDNYITKQAISEEDTKIFSLFINQAAGALENSKVYENTLLRAHTDILTSLWNYGYFQYKLDEEIIKATSQKETLSILMIDIDDFKKFNDSFGHQAGNEALGMVAQVLMQQSRKIDILCRYGGEEFAVVLPQTAKEEAEKIAQRIRNAIENQKLLSHRLTVSIGVSSFTEDASEKKELIRKADLALYRAKSEGKNRVVVA